jgi:hypothetical protein
MEKIKDFVSEHKTALAITGGAALGVLGLYCYRCMKSTPEQTGEGWYYDHSFKIMNIPLHHTNAVLRD